MYPAYVLEYASIPKFDLINLLSIDEDVYMMTIREEYILIFLHLC